MLMSGGLPPDEVLDFLETDNGSAGKLSTQVSPTFPVVFLLPEWTAALLSINTAMRALLPAEGLAQPAF